ncbi:hypothetical protein [Sodalis ligni]|uniref:Tail spike TSP1/Gp66 N-terminal domain-containing protein n=1 Tax=Sodalis ligni TaxID=2697027 RepID=A0A4R1NMB7_9GAMM|nr:hypothetical protein [Sodalis ligni]TCL07151.1 hypothetical protein EZJ58_5462 [Sodalis ligni]
MPTSISVTGVIPTSEEYSDLVTQEELTAAIGAFSTELSSSSGGTLVNTSTGTVEERFTADEARIVHNLAPSATDPATAIEGDEFFSTTDNVYKIYRSGAWVVNDSAALALNLASTTGLSFIGQVDSVATLRVTISTSGTRISLASYFPGLECGGGELIYTADATSDDDGGTIFRVNDDYIWRRAVKSAINATWFGVTGDGVDRGIYVKAAFDYIIKNGGTLIFPEGTVNLGTMRYVTTAMNGPSFTITGYGCKIIWENVDPIPIDITTTNYSSETALLFFGADPTGYGRGDYFPSLIIEGFTFDYSNQANKGGNTYATMGVGPHPTPYSCGTTMLDIWGSSYPIVRNCTFQNCWGNALRFRNCNGPYVDNVLVKDVAANELINRLTNTLKSDSFGSGCFMWGCANGKVQNSQFINTKVYICDPSIVSPETGAVINGTLVGYIGCYAEYPMGVSNNSKVPPGITTVTDPSGVLLKDADTTQYVTFENVSVSGYVLGIKSENTTSVKVLNCISTNCYLPLINASNMFVQGGIFDKAECSYKINPQGGYYFQDSTVANGSFSGNYPNSIFIMDGATITCRHAHAIVNSKGHNRITNCRFNLFDQATLCDQLTTNTIYLTEFVGNTITFNADMVNTTGHIRITNTDVLRMTNNTFINLGTTAMQLGTNDSGGNLWNVDNNQYSGPFTINFNGQIKSITFNSNVFHNVGSVTLGGQLHAQLNGNTWAALPDSFMVGGGHPIYMNSLQNFEISYNVVYRNQDIAAGGLTAHYNFIACFNNPSRFGSITHNVINNNATTFGLRLISALLEICDINNNRSDSTTAPMVSWGACKGPINIKNNGWIVGNPSTDYNKVANLSTFYLPHKGDVVNYLLPTASGIIGIVWDGTQWLSSGTVGSTAITS